MVTLYGNALMDYAAQEAKAAEAKHQPIDEIREVWEENIGPVIRRLERSIHREGVEKLIRAGATPEGALQEMARFHSNVEDPATIDGPDSDMELEEGSDLEVSGDSEEEDDGKEDEEDEEGADFIDDA